MDSRSGRLVAVVALAGLALASTGCRRLTDRLRGHGDRAGGQATAAPAYGGRVTGLKAAGFGPSLSWDPVAGAASYAVTVAGRPSPWMWVGFGTSVPYGTVEDGTERMQPPQSDRPLQVRQPVPGAKYRWFVTALDKRGDAIASSGVVEFTYQPPAGVTQLPPRPPRLVVMPVYDCDTLVPDAVRQRHLAGYELKESSPCGGTPSPGCPWNCVFTTKEGAARRQVTLSYDCARFPDQDIWKRVHRPKGGRDVPGVGRAAVAGAVGDQTVLQIHARQASCVIGVRGNLGEPALVELGRAADAALTAELVGVRR